MAELRRRRPPAGTSEPLPSDASDTLSDTDVDCGASSASETDMAERDPSREAGSFGPAGHTSGENKLTKLVKRLFFGTSLLLFLIFVLSLGHLTTLAMLLIAQAPPFAHTAVLMFRELVNVRYKTRLVKTIPWFRTTQWGWFWCCMVYSYGNSFSQEKLLSLIRRRPPATPPTLVGMLPYVQLLSMAAYSFMLMLFVLTLKAGYYKYQVGQLAWTMAVIVVTVVQVNSFTQNIFNGSRPRDPHIRPASSGLAWGKKLTQKPFLAISPNKTWEGFFGGGICTVIFAFYFPLLLVSYFHPTVCPCEATLQSHSIATPHTRAPSPCAFASLVAPFGGFFASGIKRAYKIKDFSAIIPGHGGVFDRRRRPSRRSLSALPAEERLLLYRELTASLRDAKLL
ncbi:phosphatidate cytidylyltransferase [Emiliania huxleyi CCMP1516]|uniref:phosphatidate cytidylyltransferase n=2 Tax=Emiliania huxleyi TaxID=2903 RepID=A0A0D3JA63_EMIH1|nr:phosphatidate cytidylyltransferase [Emiliania huxleyi CCMP1516]EOD20398.1 phosphatidate cytidylyltransferase [Emiliania huxleyi CCMP1516]|eukprot:XP_005772827.1 phosphatidate cytidylyltransferase [Emiliania huxleyi CCMP1516]